MDKSGGTDAEVKTRIGKARSAYNILKKVWNSRELGTSTKIRLFNSNVKSVLLHGAESWQTTKASMKKIQTFINQCLRRILRIHWPETISNENLWARAQQTPVEEDIRRSEMEMAWPYATQTSSTGTPKIHEREGDHGTPGDGSLKRILRGLDTHGNNLKG